MKKLLIGLIALSSVSAFAGNSCRTALKLEGNCFGPRIEGDIVSRLANKGYKVYKPSIIEELHGFPSADYIVTLDIDDRMVAVGCSGSAVIKNNNEEAVGGSRASTRLEGTALVIATFGLSALVPPSGNTVAKRLVNRLPDCKNL